MNSPPEQKSTTKLPEEQLKGSGLTGQELDAVTGGGGKAASQSPKESVTFEYGGLEVQYAPQKPGGV